MRHLARIALVLLLPLAACAATSPETPSLAFVDSAPLHPNETPELRALIEKYAATYDVPVTLVQKVVSRESTHRPEARNGPYYGLMQILPSTARSMGFSGKAPDLLDAETNLKYAVKYLRGAWLLSDGDQGEAMKWYSKGYYYEAKRQDMLVETGLRTQ